jgi:hypothetical protein
MPYQRMLFNINTDTGSFGDTGPPFHGEIKQVRWNPTTADTGADLKLALLPRAGDTGDGFEFYNDNDVLGTNFNRVPRQVQHDADGSVALYSGAAADTGATLTAPIVAAGDRLRVKVIPGGAAVAGRLYIWAGDR